MQLENDMVLLLATIKNSTSCTTRDGQSMYVQQEESTSFFFHYQYQVNQFSFQIQSQSAGCFEFEGIYHPLSGSPVLRDNEA